MPSDVWHDWSDDIGESVTSPFMVTCSFTNLINFSLTDGSGGSCEQECGNALSLEMLDAKAPERLKSLLFVARFWPHGSVFADTCVPHLLSGRELILKFAYKCLHVVPGHGSSRECEQ